MGFLENRKSRRVRGAELAATGGVTMILSTVLGWVAPIAFCAYGVYRMLVQKSYKDGIISLAVGVLLLTLLRGPLNAFLWLAMVAGGFLLGIGLVMMILSWRDNQ